MLYYALRFSPSRYNPRGHSRTKRAVLALYRHWRDPRSIHGTNVVVSMLPHVSPSPQPEELTAPLRVVNAAAHCVPVSCPYNAQFCHQGTSSGYSGQCHHTTPSPRCAHPWEAAARSSLLSTHPLSTDAQRATMTRQQSTLQCRYNPRGHSRTESAVLALYRQ